MPRPVGAEVTYFGIATADNHVLAPVGETDEGVRIYEFPNNFAFILVAEGRPGTSNRSLALCGTMGYGPCADGLAAVQIIASRPLGNGSPEVCDGGAPSYGGVPAVPGMQFDSSPETADAIVDMACRMSVQLTSGSACTVDEYGMYAFVRDRSGDPVKSTMQYCSVPVISGDMKFKSGLTHLKVRLEDTAGNIGHPVEIAIQVP